MRLIALHLSAVATSLLTGAATAQSVLFSTSDTATGPFGAVEDQEIARFDVGSATLHPWLFSSGGAFFEGDHNGDGVYDDWNDVDALCVLEGVGISDVYFSLQSDQGGLKDGDVGRLGRDGEIEVAVSESRFAGLFGCTDGNLDVDALQIGSDGTWWLSFAEDENSTVLSSDSPGVIADGAILAWNSITDAVSVFMSEQDVSNLVSQVLGKTVQIGDLMSLAMDEHQELCFTVQSPSDNDGSVFSLFNGGTLYVAESSLGFAGDVEMDALSILTSSPQPIVTNVTPRTVGAGVGITVDLYGEPGHFHALLLSGTKASGVGAGFDGFLDLLISPFDPLFQISVSFGAVWLWGTFDSQGRARVQSPPTPPSVVLDVFCQPIDFQTLAVGTPGIVHLQG